MHLRGQFDLNMKKGAWPGKPGALAHLLAPGGETWRRTDGLGSFDRVGGIGPVGI